MDYIYATTLVILATALVVFGFWIWPIYTGAYLLVCAVLYSLYPIEDELDSVFLGNAAKFLVFVTAPIWFFVALKDN